MFILKKILNSANSSPDCIKCKTVSGESYEVGAPIVINSSGAAKNAGTSDSPTHICNQKLGANESNTVYCYAITKNMIFSAMAGADMSEINPGEKLVLAVDTQGRKYIVTDERSASGEVTVVNNCGAKDIGERLLVHFNI